MVAFYLEWALSVFLFQPVAVVVGFLLRFLYHPPKLDEEFAEYSKKPIFDYEDPSIYTMYHKRLKSFDYKKLLSYGDCAKFLGMYYWATDSEQAWRDTMRLCDKEHRVLHRTPEVKDLYNETHFSTDMMSGFLGAVTHRILKRGLTGEEKETLTAIWNHTTWDGMPLVLDHVGKGKELNRNCVYEPWRVWDTQEEVRMLLWLKLGHLITGERRYIIAYWMYYVFLLPMMLLSVHDGTIWVGKYYFQSPHCSHSAMLNCTSVYRLTENWLFRHLMRQRYRRRRYTSPDMLALWGTYFASYMTTTDLRLCYNLCFSTYMKGTKPVEMMYPWVDISEFGKKYGTPYLVSPMKRGADYSDERSMVKSVPMDKETREKWSLDVIFPLGILLK